jgi:hypothetical protein
MHDFLKQFGEAGLEGTRYRGVPFWAWNDQLDPEELRRQLVAMGEAGLGGGFMHARIGLETPYMSEEWMDCIRACVDEAESRGMGAWLYDEDCWPSGSAGGAVPRLGEDYLQKMLIRDRVPPGDELAPDEREIARFALVQEAGTAVYRRFEGEPPPGTREIHRFRYQVTEYVDLLSAKVTQAFIEHQYEPYAAALRDKFGADFSGPVPGIFTDEPQHCNAPWSFDLPAAYRDMWDRDLVEDLPALYDEVGDHAAVRHHYHATVLELFVEGFTKQIGEWCREHNLDFTGHVMAEDTLISQTMFIGAAMPHYEYMSLPGIDHLCRQLGTVALCKQVSSAARQFGGRRVLSEMFGCSGWNVSLEALKWMAEWQFLLGISLPCQHLSLYSMRGCRKRDYPPSLHVQQPYFPQVYRILNDRMARVLWALDQGELVADLAVIHPIETAWTLWDGSSPAGGDRYSAEFENLSRDLLRLGVGFEYADERILDRHGRVEDGRLIVGDCTYTVVLVPPMVTMRQTTLDLLRQFVEAGGTVVSVGEDPLRVDGVEDAAAYDLLSRCRHSHLETGQLRRMLDDLPLTRIKLHASGRLVCQHRKVGDDDLFFVLNADGWSHAEGRALLPTQRPVFQLDPDSGEVRRLPSTRVGGSTEVSVDLPAMGSTLLLAGAEMPDAELSPPRSYTPLGDLTPPWTIEAAEPNQVTLDRCVWREAGGEWSAEPIEVIHLQRWLEEREPRDVHLRFEVDIELEPEDADIELVLENPDAMTLRVNGQPVEMKTRGTWRDVALHRVSIDRWMKRGTNQIELSCHFVGREGGGGPVHESVGNRLRSRTELESIYLRGTFEVRSDGGWRPDERDTLLTHGPFVLVPPTRETPDGEIVSHGYPFYSGTVRLSQRFEYAAGVPEDTVLSFDRPRGVSLRVMLNGVDLGTRCWAPFDFPVGSVLRQGENEIVVEICGTNRNLLGPHHHADLEPYGVGPGQFERGSRDWLDHGGAGTSWLDQYAFVRMGLRGNPVLGRRSSGEQDDGG